MDLPMGSADLRERGASALGILCVHHAPTLRTLQNTLVESSIHSLHEAFLLKTLCFGLQIDHTLVSKEIKDMAARSVVKTRENTLKVLKELPEMCKMLLNKCTELDPGFVCAQDQSLLAASQVLLTHPPPGHTDQELREILEYWLEMDKKVTRVVDEKQACAATLLCLVNYPEKWPNSLSPLIKPLLRRFDHKGEVEMFAHGLSMLVCAQLREKRPKRLKVLQVLLNKPSQGSQLVFQALGALKEEFFLHLLPEWTSILDTQLPAHLDCLSSLWTCSPPLAPSLKAYLLTQLPSLLHHPCIALSLWSQHPCFRVPLLKLVLAYSETDFLALLFETQDPAVVSYLGVLTEWLVRLNSTSNLSKDHLCFSAFVSLCPLISMDMVHAEMALLSPDHAQFLLDTHTLGESFLTSLLKGPSFEGSFGILPGLRDYQRDAVHWLLFLMSHGLNGLLADDLGLGKSLMALQTLVVMAPASSVSLVVCPSTLVSNWGSECEKWFGQALKVFLMQGDKKTRTGVWTQCMAQQVSSRCVLVCSYSSLLTPPFDPSTCFCMCILDEAHHIRTPTNKTTLKVKQIRAQHRLALTGTPIHNDTSDLWSLFDFLMVRRLV